MRDQKLDTLSAVARQYSAPIVDALDHSLERKVLDAPRAPGRRRLGRARHPARPHARHPGPADLRRLGLDRAARDRRPAVRRRAGRGAHAARGARHRGGQRRPRGRGGAAAVADRVRRQAPRGVYVAVYSAPLADVDATVSLIRQRDPRRGAARAARRRARRLPASRARSAAASRRMERAARSVAAGDFGARFESTPATSSASSRARSTTCSASSPSSTTARKRFIATASHELRTPIFSLGGFLELLEDEDLDEETRRPFLRPAARAGRPPGQARHRAARPLAAGGGLAGAAPRADRRRRAGRAWPREFTPALAAHESHLELRLTGGPVEVECDPERVAQIMRILSTTRSPTRRPAPTSSLGRHAAQRPRAPRGDRLRDRASSAATSTRIFEPFFTSDDAQGSGLGLAIAHELAERMAGEPQRRERPRAHDLHAGAARVRPALAGGLRRAPALLAAGCGGGAHDDAHGADARRPRSRSSSRRAARQAASTRAGSTSASRPAS